MTVIHQSVITKGLYEPTKDDIEVNSANELDFISPSDTPIVFSSIQIANKVLRSPNVCSSIKQGIFYPKLNYSYYSNLIDPNWLLNQKYVILPWGTLIKRSNMIFTLFGDSVFIRPDSQGKPFTGFMIKNDYELKREVNALSQTDNVAPDELCIISKGRNLEPVEWRFWIVGNKVSTYAPYSWNFNSDLSDCGPSDYIINHAKSFARDCFEDTIVADFTFYGGRVKLVELNAITTSGWYSGMDSKKLIEDLKKYVAGISS